MSIVIYEFLLRYFSQRVKPIKHVVVVSKSIKEFSLNLISSPFSKLEVRVSLRVKLLQGADIYQTLLAIVQSVEGSLHIGGPQGIHWSNNCFHKLLVINEALIVEIEGLKCVFDVYFLYLDLLAPHCFLELFICQCSMLSSISLLQSKS